MRIFDITDIDNPVPVKNVQTCRGSHTHTIVSSPDDPANIWIYNSGTAGVRSPAGARRLRERRPDAESGHDGQPDAVADRRHPGPARQPGGGGHRQPAAHLHRPGDRCVQRLAEHAAGHALHPSGTGVLRPTPNTNTCHDITAYPELGIAAGACQGNGILLDITDPVNPVRISAVSDPNFSYWHSATLNNDGTKVIFTDEWGGGTSARCRVTDQPQWGADALFDIDEDDGSMDFASYYKMPAVQTTQENCVAHNASLVPVPGRDILVQAWYQGGVSIIDFTDTANPTEIAFFDRGPINTPNPTGLNLGGLWSTYWYNGTIYGTEIARGFDTFGLLPSDHLSENEIAAASEVQLDEFNAQHQTFIAHTPSFAVTRVVLRPGGARRCVERPGCPLHRQAASTSRRSWPTRASSAWLR